MGWQGPGGMGPIDPASSRDRENFIHSFIGPLNKLHGHRCVPGLAWNTVGTR